MPYDAYVHDDTCVQFMVVQHIVSVSYNKKYVTSMKTRQVKTDLFLWLVRFTKKHGEGRLTEKKNENKKVISCSY